MRHARRAPIACQAAATRAAAQDPRARAASVDRGLRLHRSGHGTPQRAKVAARAASAGRRAAGRALLQRALPGGWRRRRHRRRRPSLRVCLECVQYVSTRTSTFVMSERAETTERKSRPGVVSSGVRFRRARALLGSRRGGWGRARDLAGRAREIVCARNRSCTISLESCSVCPSRLRQPELARGTNRAQARLGSTVSDDPGKAPPPPHTATQRS